jgi:hypothetical protein
MALMYSAMYKSTQASLLKTNCELPPPPTTPSCRRRRPDACTLRLMGDCRIRVQVSKALLRHVVVGRQTSASSSSLSTSATTKTTVTGTSDDDLRDPSDLVVLLEAKNWASDSTIRELMENLSIPSSLLTAPSSSPAANEPSNGAEVPTRVLALLESHVAKLWDCTRFPPVDITSWPLELYSDQVGLKSRTLCDAGWFPGGTLVLLPHAQSSPAISSRDALHDDPQYNRIAPAAANDPSRRVELQGSAGSGADRPTPSQVLSAVSSRFASDSVEDEAMRDAEALAERVKNRNIKRAKEEARLQKLEARIRKLDEVNLTSAKNKKVSDQVQRMLIKSRASGRSDLKVQDRFYLRCLVDDGISSMAEEFRYFSTQDTTGRILSSFSCATKPASELLVSRQSSYRRLPVLSRVYELVADGHLSEFDRVVVRWYDPDVDDGPTSSVDDNADDNDAVVEHVNEVNDAPNNLPSEIPSSGSRHEEGEASLTNGAATHEGSPPTASLAATPADHVLQQLHDALAAHDQGTRNGKATQRSTSTAAFAKVRQMQMKGRAVGDKKRVKIEDRFFVELVIVADAGDSAETAMRVVESSAVFMAKTDSLSRLIRDCVRSDILTPGLSSAAAQPAQIDLLVPSPSGTAETASFRPIADATVTFADAERDGIFKCFDRVVAYVHR